MKPWFAAMVLALLMCVTLTCYFFQIPDELRKRGGKVGVWGPPNAEFDWCEPNYELADWLAEPVNSVSNLAIILPAIMFLASHKVSPEVVLVAVLQASIGIGSVLFHGSLRYSMQLLDEVPMLWYAVSMTVIYIQRLTGRNFAFLGGLVCTATTLGIIGTRQHSTVHEVFRGLMSITFSVCVVGIAWGATSLKERIQEAYTDKRRHLVAKVERSHVATFLAFVLAVVCWLMDNYFCPALWRLPFGLPYPHLHTWWHLLVGVAVQGLLILLQLDDKRNCSSSECRYVLGVLPYKVCEVK